MSARVKVQLTLLSLVSGWAKLKALHDKQLQAQYLSCKLSLTFNHPSKMIVFHTFCFVEYNHMNCGNVFRIQIDHSTLLES